MLNELLLAGLLPHLLALTLGYPILKILGLWNLEKDFTCDPPRHTLAPWIILRLCIAWILGTGLFSFSEALVLIAIKKSAFTLPVDAAAILVAYGFWLYVSRKKKPAQTAQTIQPSKAATPKPKTSTSENPRAVLARGVIQAVAVGFIVASITNLSLECLVRTLNTPIAQNSGSESIASNWLLYARFLFRGGTGWSDLFSSELFEASSQANRLLLVPLTLSRGWNILGAESQWAVALYSVGFVKVLLYSIAALVWLLRGPVVAAFAIYIVTANSDFMTFINPDSASFAHIASAAFATATITAMAAMAVPMYKNKKKNCLLLACLLAGLTAFTQSDSIILGMLLSASVFGYVFLTRKRFPPKTMGRVILVCASAFLIPLLFKFVIPKHFDFSTVFSGFSRFEKFFSIAGFSLAAKAFETQLSPLAPLGRFFFWVNAAAFYFWLVDRPLLKITLVQKFGWLIGVVVGIQLLFFNGEVAPIWPLVVLTFILGVPELGWPSKAK